MNWRQRVAAAQERGSFTDADRDMAAHFTTCAVGERASFLGTPCKSGGLGGPTYDADRLGMAFYTAVDSDEPGTAERILAEIEALPASAFRGA